MNRPHHLLFLCTHNACRSILAEAIGRQFAPALLVASAGSQPRGSIHPSTRFHLERHGLPTQDLHSQHWDALETFQPDIVITVCDQAAGESCPIWLTQTPRVHWGLPDPSRETDPTLQAQAFDQIIALLSQRLAQFHRYVSTQPTLEDCVQFLQQLADH